MREQVTTLVAAAISSGVVWHLGMPELGPVATAMVSMVCAVCGVALLVLVVKAWRWSRPLRVEWHRGRARALTQVQERIGWLIPGSFFGWLVLEVLSHFHTLRIEALMGVG